MRAGQAIPSSGPQWCASLWRLLNKVWKSPRRLANGIYRRRDGDRGGLLLVPNSAAAAHRGASSPTIVSFVYLISPFTEGRMRPRTQRSEPVECQYSSLAVTKITAP